MPRIRVDHGECVSSGACVLEEPDLFAYQEGPEALAIALPAAQDLSRQRMEELTELCPVSAIVVEDDPPDA